MFCLILAGVAIFPLLRFGPAFAQPVLPPSTRPVTTPPIYVDHRHELDAERGQPALSFRVLEPASHAPSEKAPLLIYLHGAGGSLDEVNLMRAEYDRLRNLLSRRGYYLLLPGLGPSHWMNDLAKDHLDRIVDRAMDLYPIDRKRVHIMGTSMGGGGALTYAIHRPDLIRSVCSHLGMTDMNRWYRETNGYGGPLDRAFGGSPDANPVPYEKRSAIRNIEAFSNLPVFLVYGARDRLVSPEHGRRLADALTAKGFHAQYREHPTEGHTDRSIRGFEDDLAAFFDATGQAVHILTTAPRDGTRFGVLGPKPKQPAPTLLILAGSIELALGEAYFRQAGNRLRERGWLCVSLDLPAHGMDRHPDEPEGLRGWRHRIDREQDFVAPWTARVSQVLDFLTREGYSDPERIAACGTSRGGYMALQAAAHDRRIAAVAAFAPVTNLASLREFRGAENHPTVKRLSIAQSAPTLADRAVWLVIGDHDVRVGTDETVTLARQLSATATRSNQPGRVELHVLPANGHTTPAGAAIRAARWIQAQFP